MDGDRRRDELDCQWRACVQMNRDMIEELSARYGKGFLVMWQRDKNPRLTSFLVAQTTFKSVKDRYEAECRALDAQKQKGK